MSNRKLQLGGLALTGMASRVLPASLGSRALKALLAERMADLKGVPLKLGQILAMGYGEENASPFKEALKKVSPLTGNELRAWLCEAAPEIAPRIRELSEPGIAASLGQVHRVVLDDERAYALKLQYPGIGGQLRDDALFMQWVTGVFGEMRQGFALGNYRRNLIAGLQRELDYRREAISQQELGSHFSGSPNVCIPEVYPALSGDRYLMQSWEASQNLEIFLTTATEEYCEEAAEAVTEFYLRSLLEWGFVHADPNPGNLGFRTGKGPRLVVYDHGTTQRISEVRRSSLLHLFSAEGARDPFPALVTAGFQPETLERIRSRLPALMDVLLEPLTCEGRYRLTRWKRKARIRDILGSERFTFMTSAPSDMLPVMRHLQGLFHYVGRLGDSIHAAPWLAGALAAASKTELSFPETPAHTGMPQMATVLEVRVWENGEEKIKLSLPRRSIEHLEEILDPDLKSRISMRGIDLEAKVREARIRAYAPMDVFVGDFADKRIEVKLV